MPNRPDNATTTPVAFSDLEGIERHLVDAYESAHGVCDEGLAAWEDLGEPVVKALTIVRRILVENAA